MHFLKKIKYHIAKHKFFLFIIASWLIARLYWAFEISRLALYRTIPKQRVDYDYVTRQVKKPRVSHWSYENKRFSIINFDDESEAFIVYKLPELNQN